MPLLRGDSTAFLRRPALLCSFATAVLWWLAGAFSLAPLGWVALAPFFYVLFNPNLKRRFRFGWKAGFVSFALINWWIIPTIVKGAPAIGAPAIVGLLLGLVSVGFIAAVHGLQVALVGWQSERKLLWTPLWCALLWTGLDALRTVSPLAHAWGALAFSQTRDLPLLQIAAVLGQHGLTFVCAFVAASLAMGMRSRAKIHFIAPVVLLVVLHGYGALVLAANPLRQNGARVLLVQTYVSTQVKSGNAGGESPFAQAFRLTKEGTRGEKFDLVVWPETTADFQTPASYGGSQTRRLSGLDWSQLSLLGPKDTSLLIGAQEFFSGPNGNARRNDAVLIEPGKLPQGRAKERLVPFGERAPFVEFLPFLAIFSPRPECLPGTGEDALNWTGGKIAPIICFESCFPDPAKRLSRGASLLASMTNDELFGGTEAPRQHAQMGVLRAVENGIPLVQSSNGGESFACDAQGRILVHVPFGEARSVAVRLP
ncbi:apolipoprotein N-acyltransferase [Abditibacteriota bacterium]|nr:apolipoprotein N-acyltransferase [Abditibacteriota bacterium]